MESKTLELLVVEDTERHMSEAKDFFSAQQLGGANIKVDYAVDYDDAVARLEAKTYDGIISDMFFPAKDVMGVKDRCASLLKEEVKDARWNGRQDYVDAYESWRSREDDDAPAGVLLLEAAVDTPIVYCTDMHHHKPKMEIVTSYLRRIHKEEVVDFEPQDVRDRRYSARESGIDMSAVPFRKDWSTAYQYVLDLALSSQVGLNKDMYVLRLVDRAMRDSEQPIESPAKFLAEIAKHSVQLRMMGPSVDRCVAGIDRFYDLRSEYLKTD
ncbi:MAG: hypothetical protein ABIH41_06880 [Nanoarchaeota archaeon]